MKPVSFPEANAALRGRDDEEVGTIPDLRVYRDEIGVLSKWEMDPIEHLICAKTGVIWVRHIGATCPPLALFASRPFDDQEAENELLEAHAYALVRTPPAASVHETAPSVHAHAPNLRELIDDVLPQRSLETSIASSLCMFALAFSVIAGAKPAALFFLAALWLLHWRAAKSVARLDLLNALDEAEEALDGD